MDFLTFCATLAGYLFLLTVGGLIADYVLPHIRPLMRYIDRLPLMQGKGTHHTENRPTRATEGRKAA